MNTNQSIPLYRDGRHYDALNSFLVADIPFYVEEAKRVRSLDIPPYRKERGKVGHPDSSNPLATGGMRRPVLELACGTGRLTIPIAQSGVEIVGLDIAPSMLAHARAKAEAAEVKIQFAEGDCRSFDLGQKFALIFMAFNSMQHLHDYQSLAALFRSVRKHLAKDGRFVFDVFNPKVEILARAKGDRRLEREYQDPDGAGTMAFEYSGTYDDASQVSHIQCYFVRRGASVEELDVRVEQLHLRSFFPQELDLLVRSQGFEIVEKFGNFERKPFASGDPKQVVVCKSRWESVVVGAGVRWSEIFDRTTNLGKQGFSLQVIKEWRTREEAAGRPSELADFFRAHNLCFTCRCTGVVVTGIDEDASEHLYDLCPVCRGTGRC